MKNETFFSGSGLRFGQSYKHSFATNPWFFSEAKTSWQDFNGGLTVTNQTRSVVVVLVSNMKFWWLTFDAPIFVHTGWNHQHHVNPLRDVRDIKRVFFSAQKTRDFSTKNTRENGRGFKSFVQGGMGLGKERWDIPKRVVHLGFATTSP